MYIDTRRHYISEINILCIIRVKYEALYYVKALFLSRNISREMSSCVKVKSKQHV